MLRRVEKDRGDSQLEAFTFARFFKAGLDLEIWGFALIFLSEFTLLPLTLLLFRWG